MVKRMLIDATHPEETRVVVVSGKRLEEFDFETTNKKQLKGNIYLAKVTRVEPSLQAAFVEYGGNRHGFLAFNEIHPDYYRIPVADREALLAEHAAMGGSAEDPEDTDDERDDALRPETPVSEAGGHGRYGVAEDDTGAAEDGEDPDAEGNGFAPPWEGDAAENGHSRGAAARAATDRIAEPPGDSPPEEPAAESSEAPNETSNDPAEDRPGANGAAPAASTESLETVGGDEDEIEDTVQPQRGRNARRYKIQEVIKRRQIMLVQVTKEERGNKGAALTTYLSLAGRYCVLMPNTARGGGVSRKITSPADRKRLKSIIEELDIPEGMAVIVRTAGSERSKAEIRRDYDYLLRLWDEIRELTLKSTAPALIYEEANLIKRSIRDLYSRDIEDILVEGEEGYRAAKAFMRTLTPSHAKRVQLYKDPGIPLFHRFQVEGQLDAIHNPVVQLKSGGYIVINPTEALVAIDVNSGRSTRERNIEETALRTNLEAAEEIARQLRLRDLAGLVVIDFIDMEEGRHNTQVERRLKDAMRNDRARIQLGHISPFGLLELSRQRLRPSLVEASTEICPRCRGVGHIRSTESTALHVLRSIEEEGIRNRSAAITVEVPTAVALYVLNQKRKALQEIEARHGLRVFLAGDETLVPPDFRIERMKALAPEAESAHPVAHVSAPLIEEEFDEAEGPEPTAGETAEAGTDGEQRGEGRRRSRRRRRRRDETARPAAEADEAPPAQAAEAGSTAEADGDSVDGQVEEDAETARDDTDDSGRRRRRRGRRGGRRRSRRGEEAAATETGTQAAEAAEPTAAEASPQPEESPEDQGHETDATAAETPEEIQAAVQEPVTEPLGHEEPQQAAPDGPAQEEPIIEEPAVDPDEAPSEPPALSETDPWTAVAASAGGEPVPQPEDAAGLAEPLAHPDPEAARAAPTEQTEEAPGLRPDDAHRTEPDALEPAGSERHSPESAGEVSYLPLPAAREPAEARESEETGQDHRPSDHEAGQSGPRRRGWWRRQAE